MQFSLIYIHKVPFGSLSFNNTGYGSAGVGRKVQPDLLFRIASISKTVTAVGIMRLVEERKLSLEDIVFGPQGRQLCVNLFWTSFWGL